MFIAIADNQHMVVASTFTTINAADMIAMKSKSISSAQTTRLNFAVSSVETRRIYDIENTFIMHVLWVTALVAFLLMILALYLDMKRRNVTRTLEEKTYLVRS